MNARELNGQHIGEKIEYCVIGRNMEQTWRTTDNITMITHKKNGHVLVRHGKSNRHAELKPEYAVEVLWNRPISYTATWVLDHTH